MDILPSDCMFQAVVGVCPDGWVVKGVTTDYLLLLTTAWSQIPAGGCEKVASDFDLGNEFPQVLWFPPPLTTG